MYNKINEINKNIFNIKTIIYSNSNSFYLIKVNNMLVCVNYISICMLDMLT